MIHYGSIGICAFHRGFSLVIDKETEHIVRQREQDSCFRTLFSLIGGLSRTDIKSDPGSALRMLRVVYVAEGKSQRLAVPPPQS